MSDQKSKNLLMILTFSQNGQKIYLLHVQHAHNEFLAFRAQKEHKILVLFLHFASLGYF